MMCHSEVIYLPQYEFELGLFKKNKTSTYNNTSLLGL